MMKVFNWVVDCALDLADRWKGLEGFEKPEGENKVAQQCSQGMKNVFNWALGLFDRTMGSLVPRFGIDGAAFITSLVLVTILVVVVLLVQ